MNNKETSFKYGTPVNSAKASSRRKRLPQYDECLREFLKSGNKYWKVKTEALPSDKPRVVLSSLKWRIKHFPKKYGKVKAFMSKGEIYLERVEGS